jgi:hypothetical protein
MIRTTLVRALLVTLQALLLLIAYRIACHWLRRTREARLVRPHGFLSVRIIPLKSLP